MNSSWAAAPGLWSYGVAALAFTWFALRLAVRWRIGGKPAMLLAFGVATAAASIGACVFAVAPSLPSWLSAFVLDLLRSMAILGFLLAFLGVRDAGKGAQRGGASWVALVCVGVVLVLVQLLVGLPPPGFPEGDRLTHQFGFATALAIAIFGLLLTEQCYRRTPAQSRWHVRPLLLGFVGLLGYDVVLYSDALLFRLLDPDIWAARGLAQAITVPLLALTLERTRNWSFDLSVSRGVVAGSTALAATGVYLLVMASAGFFLRYVGGSWGRALEAVLVFAALLLLAFVSLSTTYRAKVRVFVAKHFFTYRYDYRQEWLRFTTTLTASTADQPWSACIQALGDLVESPGGGLWLRQVSGEYQQVARSSMGPSAVIEGRDAPLPALLRRTGWVLELADVRAHPDRYEQLQLPESIAGLRDAWLVVPLQTADELVGFVVLTTPRVPIEIDWEVRDLLKTAGRQAASYLAYTMATEALLEARKFDAFHRMSTFVVHDLKNLVAQLQLLLSNVERHRDNPDFHRDMLRTIEHVVGRMNQLMMQLRPDASGGERAHPVDVGDVVRRVQSLRTTGRSGLKLSAPDGILAWAHEDRLERVIAHLVQNAFDASGNAPDIDVNVGREGEDVLIDVNDRGIGMSEEFIRDRLFKPFQTTKDTGMGIGAFESQQYIQQVGGRIEVESRPQAGTRVRVRLRAVAAPRLQGEAAA